MFEGSGSAGDPENSAEPPDQNLLLMSSSLFLFLSVSGRNVSPSGGHRGESRLSSVSLSSVSLSPLSLQVSLGTSDTLFLSLAEPRPSLEGHVFCSPVEPDGFMALLW